MEKNTIINKLTKKPLAIDDFFSVVPFQFIQERMYTKDYRRFLEWIKGQTTLGHGVFRGDLERFLNGEDSFRD